MWGSQSWLQPPFRRLLPFAHSATYFVDRLPALVDDTFQLVAFRYCQRARCPVDNCVPLRLTDGSETMNVAGSAIQPFLGKGFEFLNDGFELAHYLQRSA
jgi:hypothetical protein